jgi:tetratricopeptide (TPR) repeat protein
MGVLAMLSRLLSTALVVVCFWSLAYGANEPPKDWEAIQNGNPNSRFVGDREQAGQCTMEVHRGGLLGLKKDFSSLFVMMSAQIKSWPNVIGVSSGVYIYTDKGALLKLERVWTPQGGVIRFSASAGEKDFGKKEIAWSQEEPTLVLVRRKDTFIGLIKAADQKPISVASLKWPDLATKGTVGVIATNHSGSDGSHYISFAHLRSKTLARRLNFASTLAYLVQPDNAEKVIRDAIEVFGEQESLYTALARLYDQTAQFDKKIPALQRVLELNPKSVNALNSLGWHFIDNGTNLQEGLRLAKKALSLSPGNTLITDTVGWGYYKLGQHAEARRLLEQSVAGIKKKPKMSHGEIAYFEHLGQVCRALGDREAEKKCYHEAIDLLNKTLDSEAYKPPELLSDLAWMYYRLERYEDAKKQFECAIEEIRGQTKKWGGPEREFAEVYERAGDLYAKTGLEKRALDAYTNAARISKRFKEGDRKKRVEEKMTRITGRSL